MKQKKLVAGLIAMVLGTIGAAYATVTITENLSVPVSYTYTSPFSSHEIITVIIFVISCIVTAAGGLWLHMFNKETNQQSTDSLTKKKTLITKISDNTDLCKAIVFFTIGYIFCHLFLLDYSVPGMNILDRWSTTSSSQIRHPILFAVWCIATGLCFLLNIERMRNRYNVERYKSLAILQYLGFLFIIATCLVPTHRPPHETISHYLQLWVHRVASSGFGILNGLCIYLIFIIKMKKDKRFKPWFWGGTVSIIAISAGIAFVMCGLVELVPVTGYIIVSYIFGFTNLMPPLEAKQEEDAQKKKELFVPGP